MTSRDAEQLIAGIVPRDGGSWADLGAGQGVFTNALAELLGPGGTVYAVDRDAQALAALQRLTQKAPARVVAIEADFTRPFDWSGLGDGWLDGLLFANALHFVPDPGRVLARLAERLRVGGRVVVIEYDQRPASRWVPYPLPADRLSDVTRAARLSEPAVVATRPSEYGGHLYVATATKNPLED